MAPPSGTQSLEQIEAEVKRIVQQLYNLTLQALDYAGQQTQRAMDKEIGNLWTSLYKTQRQAENIAVELPPEVIQYVEDGRNPDIYTREFVEFVQKNNQMHKGKSEAYLQFQQILSDNISGAIPDMAEDVNRIMEQTAGMRNKSVGINGQV